MLTIRALKKYNCAISLIHLTNGVRALDFLLGQGEFLGNTKNKPKVIFLDLKMPNVSGLDVLRVIKKDERTKHIPVVMISSTKEVKDIVECYDFGVNSFVLKSLDFKDFSKTIAELGYYWLILNNTS